MLMKPDFEIVLQNVTDLLDLTTSGREQKESETLFAEKLTVRREGFQAGRYCIYQYFFNGPMLLCINQIAFMV